MGDGGAVGVVRTEAGSKGQTARGVSEPLLHPSHESQPTDPEVAGIASLSTAASPSARPAPREPTLREALTRARTDERLDDLLLLCVCREHQRGRAVIVARVDVRLRREQSVHDSQVAW